MPMPDEFIALIQRYCQLGRLLPDPGDTDEVHERADECRIILAEMHAVQERMDEFLEKARAERGKH
jgi:hypothetical protein